MLVLTMFPDTTLLVTFESEGVTYEAKIIAEPGAGKRTRFYIDAPQEFQFLRVGGHGAGTDKEGRELPRDFGCRGVDTRESACQAAQQLQVPGEDDGVQESPDELRV